MARLYFLLSILTLHSCAQSQVRNENQNQNENEKKILAKATSEDIQVGGPCEGCEAVFEYGDRELTWIDTLDDFTLTGQRIAVSGTIYQPDGKTPAKDVILYLYHTDQTGEYTPDKNSTGWGRRHGALRTWLKTNDQGQYAFYTLRPASYPDSDNEAHIHATIKEPGKSPYWIDEFVFDDDPFLTKQKRTYIKGRGGYTGVLSNGKNLNGVMKYTRDITLGLNVY